MSLCMLLNAPQYLVYASGIETLGTLRRMIINAGLCLAWSIFNGVLLEIFATFKIISYDFIGINLDTIIASSFTNFRSSNSKAFVKLFSKYSVYL